MEADDGNNRVACTAHVRSRLSLGLTIALTSVSQHRALPTMYTQIHAAVSEGLKSSRYTSACLDHYLQTAMYTYTQPRAKRCASKPFSQQRILTGKSTESVCVCTRVQRWAANYTPSNVVTYKSRRPPVSKEQELRDCTSYTSPFSSATNRSVSKKKKKSLPIASHRMRKNSLRTGMKAERLQKVHRRNLLDKGRGNGSWNIFFLMTCN